MCECRCTCSLEHRPTKGADWFETDQLSFYPLSSVFSLLVQGNKFVLLICVVYSISRSFMHIPNGINMSGAQTSLAWGEWADAMAQQAEWMPPVGVEWRGHCIHLFGGEEDVDWEREGIKRRFPNRGGEKNPSRWSYSKTQIQGVLFCPGLIDGGPCRSKGSGDSGEGRALWWVY